MTRKDFVELAGSDRTPRTHSRAGPSMEWVFTENGVW